MKPCEKISVVGSHDRGREATPQVKMKGAHRRVAHGSKRLEKFKRQRMAMSRLYTFYEASEQQHPNTTMKSRTQPTSETKRNETCRPATDRAHMKFAPRTIMVETTNNASVHPRCPRTVDFDIGVVHHWPHAFMNRSSKLPQRIAWVRLRTY